jgi:hypothetical protein
MKILWFLNKDGAGFKFEWNDDNYDFEFGERQGSLCKQVGGVVIC